MKKWIIIGISLFIILGALILKIYIDLTGIPKDNALKPQITEVKKPQTKEKRLVARDNVVQQLLVMLSNQDYHVPKLFDSTAFNKNPKTMGEQERMKAAEFVFWYFLKGHQMYNIGSNV
ncbi:hypothetical protein [Ectobacillus antri]|uniref:hypothetical protein n=1 Tax=Ectobacillus antri TaxID=2486280 RepID=UPI000F5B41AE|nr:hypothetical protein [Ectobacillus antri]